MGSGASKQQRAAADWVRDCCPPPPPPPPPQPHPGGPARGVQRATARDRPPLWRPRPPLPALARLARIPP